LVGNQQWQQEQQARPGMTGGPQVVRMLRRFRDNAPPRGAVVPAGPRVESPEPHDTSTRMPNDQTECLINNQMTNDQMRYCGHWSLVIWLLIRHSSLDIRHSLQVGVSLPEQAAAFGRRQSADDGAAFACSQVDGPGCRQRLPLGVGQERDDRPGG